VATAYVVVVAGMAAAYVAVVAGMAYDCAASIADVAAGMADAAAAGMAYVPETGIAIVYVPDVISGATVVGATNGVTSDAVVSAMTIGAATAPLTGAATGTEPALFLFFFAVFFFPPPMHAANPAHAPQHKIHNAKRSSHCQIGMPDEVVPEDAEEPPWMDEFVFPPWMDEFVFQHESKSGASLGLRLGMVLEQEIFARYASFSW